MLKKVLLILAALILIFIGVVASRPDHYHVERSVEIEAPAEVVFANINNLRAYTAWSPWEKMEPNVKRTFEGPAEGAGAIYMWEGDEVGQGKMTIVEALPPSSVGAKLEFIKPFSALASVNFKLAEKGQRTRTTWSIDGKNAFIGKLFGLFLDMDKALGADFERGLAELKRIAEDEAQKRAAEAKKQADAQAAAAAAKTAAEADAPVEPGAQPDP